MQETNALVAQLAKKPLFRNVRLELKTMFNPITATQSMKTY